jgi:5,10-methylenetetrahydromethanopterin reductase
MSGTGSPAGEGAGAGRAALYLQDAHRLADGLEYVRYAEERGFEAVWQAESRLVREATVPMAAYAAVTSRIRVGSGVIPIWTRNVGLLAATFATLDDLAPGRVILGLGGWWEPLASKVGVRRHHPLAAMREVVTAVRRLLAMERVTFHGEFVHLDGVEIDVVHGDRSPRRVPVYIGATGPRMLELAGEIADGVLLNYLVSPAYNEAALAALAVGAERAGRSLDELDRPQLVVCSVDHDRAAALDRSRELLTQYLGQQPHIMKASGVDPELIDKIGQAVSWPAGPEQIRAAMRLVPDDVVQMITASGTPAECRAKVAEYLAAGATCPVLYPLGGDVRLMIDTFAPGPAAATASSPAAGDSAATPAGPRGRRANPARARGGAASRPGRRGSAASPASTVSPAGSADSAGTASRAGGASAGQEPAEGTSSVGAESV